MSDFSTILGRTRTYLLEAGVRYTRATTTTAGASNGTTMISTALTELDDAHNDMDCTLLDGALSGLKKYVEDFTASSDTLTFTNNAWPARVATGVLFELTERGIWDGADLRRIIAGAANRFLRLVSDLGVNYAVEETIGAVSGIVDLPVNVLKFVPPVVVIDGNEAAVIDPKRLSALDDDPFIDPVNGDPIGGFLPRDDSTKNVGRFKFKPATNASCVWNFVPIASFDSSGNWKVPEEAWEPIIFMTVSDALLANERADLAQQ